MTVLSVGLYEWVRARRSGLVLLVPGKGQGGEGAGISYLWEVRVRCTWARHKSGPLRIWLPWAMGSDLCLTPGASHDDN